MYYLTVDGQLEVGIIGDGLIEYPHSQFREERIDLSLKRCIPWLNISKNRFYFNTTNSNEIRKNKASEL